MEFDQMNQFSEENIEGSASFREILDKYLIHLKWFVLSVLVFGILAFLKLRYEVPKYSVSASILIKEKEKGSSFTDLSSFEDLGLFSSGDNSLENEIQILKSRKLVTKVAEELQLNTRYFIENSPYDIELYPNFPIILNIKSDPGAIDVISTEFKIQIISKKSFEFIDYDDEIKGKWAFGQEFTTDLGNKNRIIKRSLSIDLNENFQDELVGKTVRVKIIPMTIAASIFMEKLVIEPVNEKLSKVLKISIEDDVTQKGITIVNNLIEQYNADGINDNKEIAQTTIDFLDLRLGLISAELEAIESTAEQFKTRNRMVDISAGADYFLQSSSTNESDVVEANTQRELATYMLTELNQSRNDKLLPGNIGLSDPSIVGLIGEYNNLILQRNRILKSSSEMNPFIVNLDSQLNDLKSNLKVSLETLQTSLQIQINALNTQGSRINSRIASVPKNEREFKDIVRQQETKNALYLFLLQKREESILANAISVEKAKIIDYAFSRGVPVSPKKKTIYILFVLMGFIVPVGFIYVRDILDTKVHGEKDIAKLKIPFLGDVPLSTDKKKVFITDVDNSSIAEAFRYVRTNINFMLDSKSMGKTIFVTSTQSGEGKTFVSINLASSLAMSGKKTLLIGMDLRAPKITRYLDLEDILGVTNYIKNDNLTLNEITEKYTKFDNLHLVNSGDIPPNPVELLMSKRVNELFEEVKKKYEYIIVDTAPVGMVTDTIQLGKLADLTIYVVKANFLDKRMLHIPDKLHRENKLSNMAVLINGTDQTKGGYGYGYGYGNEKKKAWHKRK